jgi:puromycin-sensitive aminopeptidase
VAESAKTRLPRTAAPRRYQLELIPDLVASRFEGSVVVTLDVIERVDQLVCNAVDLQINEASLETPDGAILAGEVLLDVEAQRAVITFKEPVEPGTGYQLRMPFTGILNDQLHGFYRSTFTTDDGAKRVIAVTQFEATDARRAFPCWDEPDFKATFAVTLVVDQDLLALSNGAVLSEEPAAGGRRRVTFIETMPMSTYVVAMIVGAFELTSPREIDGVTLRVVSVPDKANLTGFAIEAGSHALRFFSRYFEIPYPTEKIDHVAIPDFAFGAMENLGCVTYRETALLVDPAAASQLELHRVASVIAHETAHMWFGDLVTMKWWNGIWLNEAFATFMEVLSTDDFNPDWDVWTGFGLGKAAALATDGLRNTRPIEYPVEEPQDADAMFDVLTYQKGGAVLRMLEQYLGPDTFRAGVRRYLKTHAYANTETTDLWDAIEAVSGEPVRAVMDSWIFQGGYPLLSVRPEGDRSVTLTQRRFLYQPEALSTGDESKEPGARWGVPVNLRAAVGGTVQRRRLLLTDDSATVDFEGPLDWVVANDGAWGFYRVRYEASLLQRLVSAGLATICEPLERMALVDDRWAQVLEGATGLDEWAWLVEALGHEVDPDVWSSVTGAVRLLDLIGDDKADRPAIRSFVGRVCQPMWSRLGWDPPADESKRLGLTRARLMSALALFGDDAAVRDEATRRFHRYRDDGSGLAPDLLTAVTRVVAASGGSTAWHAILDLYRSATTPQDKARYLFALPDTDDVTLLSETLDMTLSQEVRSQDAAYLISGVMTNRLGGKLAWEWLEQHWDEVRALLPVSLFARVFEGIVFLLDPTLATAVHEFASTHDLPLAGPRVEQLLEHMDINVAVAGRLRGHMEAALKG